MQGLWVVEVQLNNVRLSYTQLNDVQLITTRRMIMEEH